MRDYHAMLLFSCLVALLVVKAHVVPEPSPQDYHRLEKRACKPPANFLKNGGFEAGLTSWRFHTDYSTPYNNVTLSGNGDRSGHSVYFYGRSLPGDRGNSGYFNQEFFYCKKVQMSLSFSAYQVPKQTYFDYDLEYNRAPSLRVFSIEPHNSYLDERASIYLGRTYFNYSRYESFPTIVKVPQGQWRTFTVDLDVYDFTPLGNWTIEFWWDAHATPQSKKATTAGLLIDNVIVKPK